MKTFFFPRSLWLVAACLATITCFTSLGCNSAKSKSREREQSNLKKVAILYGQFQSQHRGQPPANEAEFKKFIHSAVGVKGSTFADDKPDELLISQRDGKPYVIIYGKASSRPGPGGMPLVAYEQEGKDGKRMVASSLGILDEIDQAQFQKIVK